MASNLDHAQKAIDLIGGDEVMTRLRVRQVESINNGVQFFVPLLGGLVGVRIVRNEGHWDIDLGLDVLNTTPRRIQEVPDGNLKLIIHHLFVL